MATEMDSCCPICLDSLKEISYIFPCLHQFCYTCILQWAENTPKCPLCKRRILSILHSMETENDYMEHVIALRHHPSLSTKREETQDILTSMSLEHPKHGLQKECPGIPWAVSSLGNGWYFSGTTHAS